MASPNASLARRLQESKTFEKVDPRYREVWLRHCIELGEEGISCPQDGEIFFKRMDKTMTEIVLRRLNNYGFASGSFFMTTKNRMSSSPPSIVFQCLFHSTKRVSHKKKGAQVPEDILVRKDPVTGEIIGSRQRERSDRRLGCMVKYTVAFKLNKEAGEREWVGR